MKITRGFTLVETLVAIAVLLVVVTIPYYSVERALIASYTARDEMIATSLAQEGLEFVQGTRDSNSIYNYHNGTSNDWMGGLDGVAPSDTTQYSSLDPEGNFPYAKCLNNTSCAVDPNVLPRAIVACYTRKTSGPSDSTCAQYPLYITSSGQYTLSSSGNVLTRWTRAIKLQRISGTEELITSTVYWTTQGTAYHVTVSEYLENWQ